MHDKPSPGKCVSCGKPIHRTKKAEHEDRTNLCHECDNSELGTK